MYDTSIRYFTYYIIKIIIFLIGFFIVNKCQYFTDYWNQMSGQRTRVENVHRHSENISDHGGVAIKVVSIRKIDKKKIKNNK